jgi:energy-coupling factor transporter ATP-binding protein EcfA2
MSLELLRIWTTQPKTIVFVTHSIPEAVLLSDRVVVMSPRPGRITEIVNVPLPRPRTFEAEGLREFQSRAQHIRSLIFSRWGALEGPPKPPALRPPAEPGSPASAVSQPPQPSASAGAVPA